MQTHILGYPHIGSKRELKKACKKYWADKITLAKLQQVGYEIRKHSWQLQQAAGVNLIPSNDFAFYDQVLDLAQGYQKNSLDITAMEMTNQEKQALVKTCDTIKECFPRLKVLFV